VLFLVLGKKREAKSPSIPLYKRGKKNKEKPKTERNTLLKLRSIYRRRASKRQQEIATIQLSHPHLASPIEGEEEGGND
jgi:hypothetical protein